MGNVIGLRKGPKTIKRCFYALLSSFGWFVCVRVKTFISKFVRDVSLKIPFVLPFSDFDIEQYWPHLISLEWFPTLSFSWRHFVKLILIFKIFERILWSNYLRLKISFSKVLWHSCNHIKVYRLFRWCIYFCFKYLRLCCLMYTYLGLLCIPAGWLFYPYVCPFIPLSFEIILL